MAEFKKLLHRDDLPALCLTYYTSFDVGELSLSVLTYREIEFEETPVIPLIFMVYEREEMSAHEYFFARFAKTIPEFKTLQRMCIIADEEVVIANAIQKNCPEIPRLRCWRQALLNIKNTLQLLNIKEIQQYEKDFLRLLEQNSATNYKSLLAQMYLKKWADVNNFTFHSYLNNVTNFLWYFQKFSKYFDKNIDPDMGKMGAWALRQFGIELETADQSTEKFSCIMRQFGVWNKNSVDLMVTSLMEVADFFNDCISASRYRVGNYPYTLKEDLMIDFNERIVENVQEPLPVDEFIRRIRSRTESPKKVSLLFSSCEFFSLHFLLISIII